MHSTSATISWVLLFASLYYISLIGTVKGRVFGCLECVQNDQGECIDLPPAKACMWGETRDFCNQRICASGPGERCGGRYSILGICGTGMWCQAKREGNTEVCHGCYLERVCYND